MNELLIDSKNIESFEIIYNGNNEWTIMFTIKESYQNYIFTNLNSIDECINKYNLIVKELKLYANNIQQHYHQHRHYHC